MKNLIFLFFITVPSLHLLSCNNHSNQNSDSAGNMDSINATPLSADSDSLYRCTGTENFKIHPDTARKMIDHFGEIYRLEGKPGTKHALMDSVWIDSCVIVSLSDFLNSHSDYDGVRIYNGTYDKIDAGHPNQKYNYESTLVLMLTKPTIEQGKIIGHEDDGKIKFPRPACNPEFKNFNLDFRVANVLMQRFDTFYRKQKVTGQRSTALIDSLSSGVWFSECVIREIADTLKNSNEKFDGIRIYGAAYNALRRDAAQNPVIRGQLKPNQSTFVILLTKRSLDGGHNDDWKFAEKLYKNKKPKGDDIYNHGELCPSVCN